MPQWPGMILFGFPDSRQWAALITNSKHDAQTPIMCILDETIPENDGGKGNGGGGVGDSMAAHILPKIFVN